MKRILVAEGLWYIGSHTCVAIFEAGYHPVVVDNLHKAHIETLQAVEEITGQSLWFYELDAENSIEVAEKIWSIDGTIHFIALKTAGESIQKPMEYFTENLESILSLIKVSASNGAKSSIFSLSATVNGETEEECINEETPLGPPWIHTVILNHSVSKSLISAHIPSKPFFYDISTQ